MYKLISHRIGACIGQKFVRSRARTSTYYNALALLALTSIMMTAPSISYATLIYNVDINGANVGITGTISTTGATGGLSSVLTDFSLSGSLNSQNFSISGTSASYTNSDMFVLKNQNGHIDLTLDFLCSPNCATNFLASNGDLLTLGLQPATAGSLTILSASYITQSSNIFAQTDQTGFQMVSSSRTVPEPPTIYLSALGLFALMLKRKRAGKLKRKPVTNA